MSQIKAALAVAIVCSTAYVLYRDRTKRTPKLPLPPAAPGSYPLIGHALVQPRNEKHIAYAKWCKELNSDIISLTSLGHTIVVLNSLEVATDLMDRRSTIYSDRPQLRVISDPDLLDWSYGTGSVRYGTRWKKQRRITRDFLKGSANIHHFALMEKETHDLLKRLLEAPNGIEKELRRTVATEVLSTAYGYAVAGEDDPLVRSVETAVDNFSRAVVPTYFLVNLIPWLKYVPEWFPGTGWKQTIKEWREQRDEILHVPYNWAKTEIEAGTAAPSMVKSHLAEIASNQRLDPAAEEEYLKWAAMTLFAAASDTTVSASMSFVIAMLQYPEIQARAQAEIDEVTRGERLPKISDRDSMPYVGRIVQEVLRWKPVLPIGFPHAAYEDDEYRGYFIPKGSTVIANVWAMTRDESIYKDPETFNPDRFLDPSIPNAPAFGFGRRSCPGNYYAEASLFITFASLLAVFNIRQIGRAHV